MLLSRRQFVQSSLLATAAPSFAQEASLAIPAKRVTSGPKHSWFGYYDKCPWSKSGRYLLCQQSDFCDRQPKAGETITVGMVDLEDNNKFIELDKTAAWSWQQGTMLQWLGSDADQTVVYNTILEKQQPATMIRYVKTGATRILLQPIYAISNDGTQAVTLDYARLHRLRQGYGYASAIEKHAADPAPLELGIWNINVKTDEERLIISLHQLANNKVDDRFKDAEHWVNHLQFNPSGTRFVFLHRWKKPGVGGWQTRIYTAKPDGTDLKLLHDSGMVSHFDWRDDDTILAWVRLKRDVPGNAFALLDVGGKPPEVVFETEKQDGHCSYSPDRKWVLNDTYPDKDRMQHLMLLNVKTGRRHSINKFHSPKQFTGPVRCDLHPRWNRDGTKVCFDGCHDAQRGVYVVDIADIVRG